VFPPLPCDAAASPFDGSNLGSQLVTLKRRDGDRYLAVWSFVAPPPGEKVELHVVRDQAVYSLATHVTGIDGDRSRFLTVTELRRKTQRRISERAQIDDIVLVSHGGEVDATLVDVSGDGLAFRLDRALPINATIKAVINFQGSVIPTTAEVRNVTRMSEDEYRVGCAITAISDQHRAVLENYATTNASDRRSPVERAAGWLRRNTQ
jgi:hypothetical protein